MTLLQLTPKLTHATPPQEFLAHRCFMGCDVCQDVTRHKIRMDGISTYYTCEDCGKESEREGSIA